MKDVRPTRNSSSESATRDDNLTVDALRIATFYYDHNERANGDKDWMHKLRDHLVFDWIRDRNRQYANITQESFRDFLWQNLGDYAYTDLHSQLMNAYAKCMQSMIPCTRSKRNNSGFCRRRRTVTYISAAAFAMTTHTRRGSRTRQRNLILMTSISVRTNAQRNIRTY